MNPEDVTDEMVNAVRAAYYVLDRDYSLIEESWKRAICAAINAMPSDPELERLQTENAELKHALYYEKDIVDAASEEIRRQRKENAAQSELIDTLRNALMRLIGCYEQSHSAETRADAWQQARNALQEQKS